MSFKPTGGVIWESGLIGWLVKWFTLVVVLATGCWRAPEGALSPTTPPNTPVPTPISTPSATPEPTPQIEHRQCEGTGSTWVIFSGTTDIVDAHRFRVWGIVSEAYMALYSEDDQPKAAEELLLQLTPDGHVTALCQWYVYEGISFEGFKYSEIVLVSE